jgi:prepilin-type N-terminal cleavage/methylation domain-containing protein
MRKNLSSAFTLIETITAMAIIVILAGIVVSLHGYVTNKSSRTRARAEIAMFSTALENYKAEAGAYPQDFPASGTGAGITDKLQPKTHFNPTSIEYENASLFLYKSLTGDKGGPGGAGNPDGVPEDNEPVYLKEYDQNRLLFADRDANTRKITRVRGFQDPWGYYYGYSTAAVHEEQLFQADLKAGKNPTRKTGDAMPGFNTSSYDMWSTAGSKPTTNPTSPKQKDQEFAKWEKNW